MEIRQMNQESETKTGKGQEPSLLPEVPKKLASGVSAVALRRLQRNHQRQRRAKAQKPVAQSQDFNEAGHSLPSMPREAGPGMAMKLVHGRDDRQAPRVFSQEATELRVGQPPGLIAELQRGQVPGGGLLGRHGAGQGARLLGAREANYLQGRSGPYRVQQGIADGDSSAHKLSAHNVLDSAQLSRISGLIDQTQAVRLAQISQYQALSTHGPEDTVPDYSQYPSSHHVSKDKASAAFEKSKFQSYTNLKGGPGSGGAWHAPQLRTGRYGGQQRGVYELVEQLREPVPLDALARKQQLRKAQQSLHSVTAGQQELDRSPGAEGKLRPRQDTESLEQASPLSQTRDSQAVHEEASKFDSLLAYTDSVSVQMAPQKGQSATRRHQQDLDRQQSASRDPLQQLPLLPTTSPYSTASLSRRSHHPATGRSHRPQEQTTPLQNSKILIKVMTGASGIGGGEDYYRMQSHLPELGRGNAAGTQRHQSSHIPKSSAPSTQHKTPREQQLGVLQLAMWQRVQRIGLRGSAASQTQQVHGSAQRPRPLEKGQEGVSDLVDDTRLLSGPGIDWRRRAGGRNDLGRVGKSHAQTDANPLKEERVQGAEVDRAKAKDDQAAAQRSPARRGESTKAVPGGVHALAQLLKGKKQDTEGTESSSCEDESEDEEEQAAAGQATAYTLQNLASMAGGGAEQEEGESGSEGRPAGSPGPAMVSSLGGKLLLSVQEKYAHSKKIRRAEKKRAQNQEIDAVTGLNLKQYLMKKGFSRMIKFLERLGKERKANDTVERSLAEAAEGCKLDLSEAGLHQLVEEMNKLIARKVRRKRQEERGLAGYIGEDCCLIALKSQRFMNSTQQDAGARALDCMIDAATMDNGGRHECAHAKGEDDIQGECISLYKKLLVFRSHLQHQLRQELPKDRLVHGILDHIQEDAKQDQQHLQIFNDHEQLAKLLNDPILDIIEPDEVHQQELAILAQGSPQKARNQEKVATRVPGAVIYETKNQQTLSFCAKDAIHQVQQKMKRDKKQSQVPAEAPADDQMEGHEGQQAHKEAEERRKLARKLLMAGAGAKAASRQKQSYVDVQELIRDNQDREQQLAAHDPNSEESAAIQRRLASKLAPNVQTFYRLNMMKQMQAQEIQDSMRVEQPRQKLDLEDMDEDDLNNRKHRLGGHDEAISSKQNEYIDVTETYWKKMKHAEHLVRSIVPSKPAPGLKMPESKAVDVEQAANSLELASQRSQEPDETVYQQNILNKIEAHDKFYNKAKQEVAGNNQPPTQESEFYVNCQAQRLLAFPIFKCLNNNAMNFHSQPLSIGYCKAFASMIRSNVEEQNHLLSIHLDDCNMKDEEFSVILDAILRTKNFYPSIQSIKYSNNEMGKASVAKLAELMLVDHEQPTFSKDIYCLKELVLCNVAFRREQELRELVQVLSGPAGSNLQKLKLQQINLNQGDYLTQQEMLGHISTLVETTQNLRCLSLCQCNLGAKSLFRGEDEKLVLNTAFVKLFDSLLLNNSCLSALDVSGNPISPQIPDRDATVRDIVDKIKQLIEQKPSLASLNLSGLMLTSALTALVPAVKENSTLCYLNISNNGLLPYDQDWWLRELGILTADQPASVLSQTLLLQSDRCFQNALLSFRSQHLKDDCIAKMCKKEEETVGQDEFANGNDGNAGTEGEDGASQEADALYASMVNSAIMKRVHETRHLAKKVNVETDLGGEKIQRDTQLGGTEGIDSVVVQRWARNPELIFNTLQTSSRRAAAQSPSLESYDFQRPWSWEYVSQDAEREQQGSPGQDLESSQYLSVCIDSKRIGDHFAEVRDQQLIKLLKKWYGLDCLHSSHADLEEGSNIRDGLLVFGTITNWRVFQMLKLYKVTAALVAASESEQNILTTEVFDEVNSSLAIYKTIKNAVWSTYQSLLKNERAQTVGITDDDFQILSAKEKDELLQARCFTYSTFVCRPGKHSIFVYDIAEDKLFFKSAIVEQPLPWTIGRWSPLFLAITPPPPESLAFSPGPNSAFLKTYMQQKDVGKHLQCAVSADTATLQLQQVFLNDVSPCNLGISGYFQKEEDLRGALDAIYKHYAAILALYDDWLSESPEEFPRVSPKYLLECVRRAKLLPESKVAPESKNTAVGAFGKSSTAATKSTPAPGEDDIRQFDTIDRAGLLKVLIWLCKQQHRHNYWPSQFGKYLEEFIVPLARHSDYGKVKRALKDDEDVQDLLKAHAEHLLEFMRIASHFRGFYVGFSLNIAQQVILDGELEALKPDPVKEPETKKKKGKKGAKKAEPPPPTAPKKPPPERVRIPPLKLSKFFHQSLPLVALQQNQTDGMQGHIKSLGELAEFFYRISSYVYDEATYDEEAVPKEISSMFAATAAQKLQKIMSVAFKAAEMKVTFDQP